jgi:hypothetical protein
MLGGSLSAWAMIEDRDPRENTSQGASMNGNNVVIYGYGLFQKTVNNQPAKFPFPEQFSQMIDSGFTTVILWALHVDSSGNLLYNDEKAAVNGNVTLNPSAVSYIQQLKVKGMINKLFFSIGGSGADANSDFANILKNRAAATQNFQALKTTLSLDGIDFDYEGDMDTNGVNTIAALTMMMHNLGLATTYCPYSDTGFWLRCLALAYKLNNNIQPVSWLNLQCYDGGSENTPGEWANQIRNYKNLGIDQPEAFVVPGLWAVNQDKPAEGMCPTQMQSQFSQWQSQSPGITGGWVWNTYDVFENENLQPTPCDGPTTPTAYAQAIQNGLAGQPVAKQA